MLNFILQINRQAQLDPVAVPPSCRIHRALRLAPGAGAQLNLHLWLYRHLAAHTRPSTGSGSGLTAELAPVTVPPSCRTHAPFDWFRVRRHIQLAPGAAPQSCRTHAHFDWLWGRRHIQLAPVTVPQSCRTHVPFDWLRERMMDDTLNLTRWLYRHAPSSSECQFIYFWSFWRISTRRIFPLIVFGSSSTNSIRRGIL